MQAAGQTGGRPSSPLSRPRSNPERPPSPGYSASGRSKKRDRSHKSVDSSKRQNSLKNQDIGGLVDKDGGALNCAGIAQLYRLMQQDLNKSSRRFKEVASRRTSLAAVVAATDREDCLNKFVQLGGLPLLNHWLQDAHKGKLGDGGSSNDGDKFTDDLILTLLQALEKLPVDLHALESCNAGRSVKNLRSHKNSKIHKAAKKLVEDWKQRVDAEFMNQSEETKLGSKQDIGWSCKPIPKNSVGYMKNAGSAEGSSRSGACGSTMKKAIATSGPTLGEAAISFKKGGAALPGKASSLKESAGKMQSANAPLAEIDGSSVPDERSSNSNQPLNNGVMWSSTPTKNTISNWKDDLKSSVNNTTNMKAGASRSHASSKGVPGAGLNEGSKEVGSGKPLVRSTSSAAIDKNYNASGAFDRPSNESSKFEGCGSNQRLILRLPNTSRVPIGNSVPDGTAPTSRDSSSNFADRNLDSGSRKSRPQAVCMEDAAIKTAISRHDGTEKPVDLPGRRNEMDCPSSDSHLSFGSADCCATDFKTNSISQEGQLVDERRPDVLTRTHEKSNGCDTVDVSVGICLLASIAADENLRIEKDAASAAFEKTKHTKEGESQHREMKTCLTDSENSPLSGITENSGRMELVPDPDVKNAQDNNSECLRPGSDEGMHNLGIAATSTDVDMGQSNEAFIKTSEGLTLAQRSYEGRLEGGCGEGKSGDSQNLTAKSPPGISPDDNRGKDNEDPPDSVKICSPPREIECEDKKNPLLRATALVDTSSPHPGRYGKSGGEEKDEKKFCNNDTATESAFRFPGEDALEVARQVAKEVEQEMQSYEKISLEKESNLESNSAQRDSVLPADHPESELSQEQKLKSAELVKNDEDDVGKQETLRGVSTKKQHLKPEGERLDLLENNESEQSMTAYPSCNDTKQPSSGFEGFDRNRDDEPNELKQADEVRHPTPSADEPQQTAEVELCIEPEAPAKIDFDLNEGILSEESPHETTITAAVSYPVASIPITPVASHPAISSSLSTPIPVFAATKGAFIPPVSPHWGKGELGWKGSAATSAFRPAEPRKTPERSAIVTQTATPDVTTGLAAKPARQFLDFDLNIADEGLAEDVSRPPVQSFSASRLNLDLNRVDESEENGGAVLASDTAKNEAQSLSSTSKAIKHDFDLNHGLNVDDTAADDPADSRKNSHSHGYAGLPLAGFKMGGEIPPGTQPGSLFASVPMLGIASMMRHETPFSGAVPRAYFGVGQGQCTSPFHPDILSSGSAFPYRAPSAPSLPYGGYPFGYSSAPFPGVSASFLDASGAQFLTSSAVVTSHSRPPYLMGFTDIAAASNSAESWATRSLDLNAGPELADSDSRDERVATVRQAPAFGNPLFLGDQIAAFHQSTETADLLKRKEPEGGWDVYRTGLKQASRR